MPPKKTNADPTKNTGRKITVIDQEGFSRKDGGIYAFAPFSTLSGGKTVFKIGYANSFNHRTEVYHTYFPQGVYLVAFISHIPINPRGIGREKMHEKVEKWIFKRLEENPKVVRINTTTRLHQQEWFYCTAKDVNDVFKAAGEEFNGEVSWAHLNHIDREYAAALRNKPNYVGKIVFHVPPKSVSVSVARKPRGRPPKRI